MSLPIDEIKQKLEIIQLIAEYVELKRQSPDRYSGLCPFHSERTPSFTVSVARQRFKCFGCNAGGDVLDFYSLIEGLTSGAAIRALAERCGLVLNERPDMLPPRFTEDQLAEGHLFQVGLRWQTERELELAKDPPVGEPIDGDRIFVKTRLLDILNSWNAVEAAAAYQKVQEWDPELASECVDEAQEAYDTFAWIFLLAGSRAGEIAA